MGAVLEAGYHRADASTASHAKERYGGGTRDAKSQASVAGEVAGTQVNSSIANRAQNKKSCGNAGSVERVENQRQVFHSSHRPLEISPTPRDFHIPTAQAGRAWKSGKPKSGFPLSHTRPATMTIPFKTSKSKPNLAASGGQRTNQRRRGSRRKMSSPYARLPGSPRTGNETHFQAHSALEINIDFRLTFGLENARCQNHHARITSGS